jgi:hypothetical protein
MFHPAIKSDFVVANNQGKANKKHVDISSLTHKDGYYQNDKR